MDHVQGKYTIFVDSDDAWFPNRLKSIIEVAEKNDLDICFFGFVRNTPSGPEKGFRQPFKNGQIYTGEDILLHGLRVASIWDKVYRTDFISKYRFYPKIYHEDVEFNFRTLPFAKRIMFVDIIAYNYTWNDRPSYEYVGGYSSICKLGIKKAEVEKAKFAGNYGFRYYYLRR